MSKLLCLCLTAALLPALHAEVHYLNLNQAVDLATKQNPDILLARLDEEKAIQAVRIAKDPFTPKIYVGSGLAYTSGFPMSIEGSAPSVVQASARQFIFNRQQSYIVAEAKENVRTAGFAMAGKREDAIYRTTSLFLNAERTARISEMAKKEADSLAKVFDTVRARVQEGRELPLEATRAEANLARARQTVTELDSQQEILETTLATALGFTADDRVRPVPQDRKPPELPDTEDGAIRRALQSNQELRRLQSAIAAKGLEIRSARAARLPQVDLVAQYGLFAKFNHYQDYFNSFQRNNGQLGISFQLPLLPGPGIDATTRKTEADIAELRIQLNNTRNRIIMDTRKSFRNIQNAEMAEHTASLDLKVAREQLSVLLAQMQEGRASLSQVEQARITENDKWIAFYDAQYTLETSQWALLRETGDLLLALK